MISHLVKWLILLFFKSQFSEIKHELSLVKHHGANVVEHKVSLIWKNIERDAVRIADGFLAYLMILACVIISSMIIVIWFVTWAMTTDQKVLILSCGVILPLLVSMIIFYSVHNSWKKTPLLVESRESVEKDWVEIRSAFGSSKNEQSLI